MYSQIVDTPNDIKLNTVRDRSLDAERRLRDAIADHAKAKSDHDGSDSSWAQVQAAQSLIERRQVELQSAQKAVRQAEIEVAEDERHDLEIERETMMRRIGPGFYETTAIYALDLLPHLIAAEKVISNLRIRAAEIRALQTRAHLVASKLGDHVAYGVGIERDQSDWMAALGYRVAQLAREQGHELTSLQLTKPFRFQERQPRLDEVTNVCVPKELVNASYDATEAWIHAADYYDETTTSTESNDDAQCEGTANEQQSV